MCGLAGGYGKPSSQRVSEAVALMRHRGPDDTGTFEVPGVVLGHNRLTIIDLSTGTQPLSNEAGDIWIAFNGEIYNFPALRSLLLSKGHRFRTTTDTEVLVHLYEEKGPDMVEDLDGMFAFALWSRGRLMLARDPLGIKPLYYVRDGVTIYFASELRAAIRLGQGASGEGVREFPNGCYWMSDQGFRHYSNLRDLRSEDALEQDPGRAAEKVETVLRAAVKKRLVADVPVGVFLSGGLDSSLIAAMAQAEAPGRLHSFAVGMAGSEDLAFSRLMADHLHTEHHTYEYKAEEVVAVLPEVIGHLESYDPALVRSAVPTYFVSRLAAEHVKVVLSGEGADELFAGYEYLKDLEMADLDEELLALTRALHNTNLQRVDRMTMAHSIEGRVPFLDQALVRCAFTLDPSLKLSSERREEKWILRKVAEAYLPSEIAWRTKTKFAEGTGTSAVLNQWARRARPGRSSEETLYRELFLGAFPPEAAGISVGRTRSLVTGEIT